MCGRYSITTPAEALSRLFRFKGPMPNLPPRYNVAPTQQVPIVRRASGDQHDRGLAQVRWGLIPFWAKDASIGSRMINISAEGIARRPAVSRAFKQRRCLVPADGFYEWQATPGGKVPWRITLKDGEPFAFAGLWERWDGATDGVPVESCAIITTAANTLLRSLHYRMPVILSPDTHGAWLGDGSTSHRPQIHLHTKLPKRRNVGVTEIRRNLLALLKPYAADAMRAYRVSTAVNSLKNDGPECIEPAG